MRVQTGLERIAAGDPEVLGLLRGRKLGLLAHPASVDRRLRHAHAVLRDAGCDVRALFGPEHGYGGEAQDMIAVGSIGGEARASPPRSSSGVAYGAPPNRRESNGAPPLREGRFAPASSAAPTYSLYGASEEDLYPKDEWLRGLDAVVVDLQDVGSRYYTFVWTAVCLLRRAAPLGVEVIVLDRPNPLGGTRVEGAPQRPGYRSFVGLHDVAVRHGMTIAELCALAREREGLDPRALTLVPMLGYQRALSFADTERPWVLPSPNMPTLETAQVYPGGCLIEGTNLSEGRGTTRPFEIWGAPFVDGAQLAREVVVPGALLRPLHFTPSFHKHAGKRCGGVQVHVTDADTFQPYAAYLRWIAAVARQASSELAWRTAAYEFVVDRPAIDLLTGGPEYRSLCDSQAALDDYLAEDARGAAQFAAERAPFLQY